MLKIFREPNFARSGDPLLTMMWDLPCLDMMDGTRDHNTADPSPESRISWTGYDLAVSSPQQIVDLGGRVSGADVFLVAIPKAGVFVGSEYGDAGNRSLGAAHVAQLANGTIAAEAGYQTFTAVPIRDADDAQIGTIVTLYRDDREMSDEDISTLKLLASAASTAR